MHPPAAPGSPRNHPRKPTAPNVPHSTPSSEPHCPVPSAFFLAREDALEGSRLSTSVMTHDSTFGVQSLADVIDDGVTGSASEAHTIHASVEPDVHSPSILPATGRTGRSGNVEKTQYPVSEADVVLSSAPSYIGSLEEPMSLPGSPKSSSTRSFRQIDDISAMDDVDYHRGDREAEESSAEISELQDSSPQLIMPSIKMPSRRPFTEKGKAMGRLKILLAGAPGCGKTSLLKCIVQVVEDIVHIDSLPQQSTTPFTNTTRSRRKSSLKSQRTRESETISEIYASTKSYPPWWSDLDDSRVLRRRKSTGDVVLERNLCFVDTSAGSNGADQQTEAVVQYMNKQFTRAASAVHSVTTDFEGLLSGNGGSQVDVILYLLSEKTMAADFRNIRRLSKYSTVVPLISKSDVLTPKEIQDTRKKFSERVRDADIKLSCFGPFGDLSGNNDDDSSTPRIPFAISSATTNDDETMDASVLMSEEYVPPLVPSDLGFFLEKLFDRDNIAWFRHSAARKLIEAQRPRSSAPSSSIPGAPANYGVSSLTESSLRSPPSSTAASHVLVPRGNSVGPSDYTLARVADHSRREEQLAQVRLAKWAADLQQSLQNERYRYERLGREERAVWLTEKLGECVADGTLVPLSQTPGFQGLGEKGSRNHGRRLEYRIAAADIRTDDPLGILRFGDELARRGWVLVQVLGGVGMGLALWMAWST